jgi:hypothetical protein
MKRSLIMFGIMSLLVVSLAYAGVLNYYGKIVGNVNVQPPTFYASYENVAENWYRLLINQKPSQTGTIHFTDGNNVMFWSRSLNINSFYPATYTFYIKASATNPTTLNVRLYIADQDGNQKQEICFSSISNVGNEGIYTTSCSGNVSTLTSTDTFVWEIKGTGGPAVTNYIYIDLDGSTRIEVSKRGE